MRLMECVADWVIRLRKGVIAVFAVLSVVFGVCALTVSINYDMTDYLPPEANSTKGIAEMKRSFGMELPNATVMVKADSVTEGLAIKTKLAEADGVTDVMWLDDVVDVKQPLAVQDQDTVEAYYKDGRALYSVTVESGKEQQGVDAIRQVVGNDGAVIGNAVDQASSQQMALGESARAVVLLLPVLLIILFVSTRSWIEPLLYLICIGVGIVINLGISGVKGQMCFVTLAVVPILQLAVALDYAVFLSTAYNAAREHSKNAKAAVKDALVSSSTSIFASALVGVFAFAALVAMKFQIGPDMGWALVRGVIISYLSVITFLPALIVSCDRLIQRTHHRPFLPCFMSVSRGVVKARIPLLMVVVALVVPSYMAQSMNSFIYGTGEAAPGTQIARDTEKIEQTFNNSNQLVLLVPRGDPGAEQQLSERIDTMPGVQAVTSYATMVSTAVPPEYLGSVADNFYSPDYARIIATTMLPNEGESSFQLVERVREAAADCYGDADTYLIGQSANLYDMKQTVVSDNERVDRLTLISIFVVLLLIFRSIPIALIALVTIKAAIFINTGLPYFMGQELTFIGFMIMSIIMMGSAIDYGILLIDHYLEERKTRPKIVAMQAALPQAIPAMLVSALILAGAGLTLGFTSSNALVGPLGILLGRGALIAFVISITLLPALLLVCDRIIPSLSLRIKFYQGAE